MQNHTVQLDDEMDKKVKKEISKQKVTFVTFIRSLISEYFAKKEGK